ncbi:hypothetical protein G6F31_012643 [Rhizopus arrhizus]|nr:hypothetical protein G6F31_012643 [Rhizopus arrhizus]
MPADILAVPATLSVEEDDIDLLRRSLDMPELPYVDFSAQHERRPWRHRRDHGAGRAGAGPACPGPARAAGGMQSRPDARPASGPARRCRTWLGACTAGRQRLARCRLCHRARLGRAALWPGGCRGRDAGRAAAAPGAFDLGRSPAAAAGPVRLGAVRSAAAPAGTCGSHQPARALHPAAAPGLRRSGQSCGPATAAGRRAPGAGQPLRPGRSGAARSDAVVAAHPCQAAGAAAVA